MDKFKVGDKVVFVENYAGITEGTHGEVIRVDSDPHDRSNSIFYVKTGTGKTEGVFAKRIGLATSPEGTDALLDNLRAAVKALRDTGAEVSVSVVRHVRDVL